MLIPMRPVAVARLFNNKEKKKTCSSKKFKLLSRRSIIELKAAKLNKIYLDIVVSLSAHGDKDNKAKRSPGCVDVGNSQSRDELGDGYHQEIEVYKHLKNRSL